jgi:hypothetical protein
MTSYTETFFLTISFYGIEIWLLTLLDTLLRGVSTFLTLGVDVT